MPLSHNSRISKVQAHPLGHDALLPGQRHWWKEAVVYQIYLPSFMDGDHDGMGDLAGVMQRLPYLAGLGVDALLLRPVLPNPEFGTAEDLYSLAAEARAWGMRVLAGPGPAYLISTDSLDDGAIGDKSELDAVVDDGHLQPQVQAHHPGNARLELAGLKAYYLRGVALHGAERWMTLFLESPDTPRIVSRFGTSPAYRPVLAKLLASLLLTLRGTPMLYQGQELGLPNLRAAATPEEPGESAHVLMPWRGGPAGGFSGAQPWGRLHDAAETLNVAAQMEDRNSVWRHTQRLMELRRGYDCLVYGGFSPVFVKNKHVFCYFRISDGEKWYVEMNLTDKEVLRPGRIVQGMRLMLANYDAPAKALRPFEANVYRCE